MRRVRTKAQRRVGTKSRSGIDARDTVRLTELLCRWFDRHARKLPWRTRRRRAYSALVSEAMLQQTQVSRVVDKYRQFMRRFPTVKSLATGDEQDVLAMWQGLGYYRRARHLHAAAKMVVDQFRGRIPSAVHELQQLPGVGRYTAGAIASIVFNQHEPIVDGNVQRVLMRLFADESPRWKVDPDAWTWNKADELVQVSKYPGAFNEGLMELGATLCAPSPATPKCNQCPLKEFCTARRLGIQGSVPSPKRRKKPRAAHHHAVILRQVRTGRILLEQRPDAGMWSGMWQVPTVEAEVKLSPQQIAGLIKPTTRSLQMLRRFSYQTTHRRITFHVFAALTASRSGRWVDPADLDSLPMSNAQKRVLQCLRSC